LQEDVVFERVNERVERLYGSSWRPIVSIAIPPTMNKYDREMIILSQLDAVCRRGGFFYVIQKGTTFVGQILKKRLLRRRPEQIALDEDYAYKLWLLRNLESRKRAARKVNGHSSKLAVTVLLNIPTATRDLLYSVGSVIQQVYKNWKLLLVSDPGQQGELTEFVAEKRARDDRIHVTSSISQSDFGDILTFLESGDILEGEALLRIVKAFESNDADAVYTDEDKIGHGFRFGHFFKPDWSPELLLSMNYVGHLYAIRRDLWQEDFTFPWDQSEYYDLVLRTTARARKVLHIPEILYSRQVLEGVVSRDDPEQAKVLERFLKDRGIVSTVRPGLHSGTFRVKSEIQGDPMVTIIVPTWTRFDLLRNCLASVRRLTTYRNYEILIVYHGTVVPQLLMNVSRKFECKLLRYPDPRYAFGRMNNFGSAHAEGDFLVFLNDDTQVITPSWLEAMLEWAQLKEVAAVGAKLLYENETVNHAGDIIVGSTITTVHPMHAFKGIRADSGGYNCLAEVVRNSSCVTAACMMIRKRTFQQLGGFDGRFTSYDDVDLCLKALEKGYRNVYTPHAVLYHYETATRRGQIRAVEEYRSLMYLREKHPNIMKNGDPYYNRNLDPEGTYTLKVTAKPEDIPRLYLEETSDMSNW